MLYTCRFHGTVWCWRCGPFWPVPAQWWAGQWLKWWWSTWRRSFSKAQGEDSAWDAAHKHSDKRMKDIENVTSHDWVTLSNRVQAWSPKLGMCLDKNTQRSRLWDEVNVYHLVSCRIHHLDETVVFLHLPRKKEMMQVISLRSVSMFSLYWIEKNGAMYQCCRHLKALWWVWLEHRCVTVFHMGPFGLGISNLCSAIWIWNCEQKVITNHNLNYVF